eukprot:tig00000940_g5540.t1
MGPLSRGGQPSPSALATARAVFALVGASGGRAAPHHVLQLARWLAGKAEKPAKKADDKHAYADTLNLPQTTLPIRANPLESEPEILRSFPELYAWQERARADQEPFVLHDGPPYANGPLHIGHALNKILKDIVGRVQIQRGRRLSLVPGWDCHGLPIELKALEGVDVRPGARAAGPPHGSRGGAAGGAAGLGAAEVRRRAREVAEGTMEAQRAGFERWGVLADWGRPYATLQPGYEARQLELFAEMVAAGLVYRGLRPGTALADAELEYPDGHASRAAYVALGPLEGAPGGHPLAGGGPAFALVWTTTPWTLPANLAVAFSAQAEYVLASFPALPGARCVVAAALLEALGAKLGAPADVSPPFPGSALAGLRYPALYSTAPDCPRRLLAGEHVTTESGTGLVHIAPGHGHEDFALGRAQALPPVCPVDAAGRFTAEAGPLAGLAVLGEGTEAVLAELRARGALALEERHEHKYPYDWRTKKPVIVRTTEQWFVRLGPLIPPPSPPSTTSRRTPPPVPPAPAPACRRPGSSGPGGRAGAAGGVPAGAGGDWCVSRQRPWGVPVPVFYRADTGEALMTPESIAHVAALVREQGSDCWWTLPVERLAHPALLAAAGGPAGLVRGTDTLDVWPALARRPARPGAPLRAVRGRLDSGPRGTRRWGAPRGPGRARADVYLEGSDQHRGWFQALVAADGGGGGAGAGEAPVAPSAPSSLTASSSTSPAARCPSPSVPYPRPGAPHPVPAADSFPPPPRNVVDPAVVVEGGKNKKAEPAYGADVLRAWAASTDYSRDASIGRGVLDKTAETVRKVRNTARFLLGALAGFDPATAPSPASHPELFSPLDRYMLHRTAALARGAREAYEGHAFARAVAALVQFAVVDVSALYLDLSKDRLYALAPHDPARRACQAVLAHVAPPSPPPPRPRAGPADADAAAGAGGAAERGGARAPAYAGGAAGRGAPGPRLGLLRPPFEPDAAWEDPAVEADWRQLLALRAAVNRVLEAARADRLIGSALEAAVELAVPRARPCGPPSRPSPPAPPPTRTAPARPGDAVGAGGAAAGEPRGAPAGPARRGAPARRRRRRRGAPVHVAVRRSGAAKCPRCWRHAAAEEGRPCPRCEAVLRAAFPARAPAPAPAP